MATADKLTYLNATKLLLRDAIRRAGHYLPDAATFRSYPYALLPDESSLSMDFVRGEHVAHNWRDGTVSRAGLSNIMTTTRASGGGYFDHLGVYQWAANNTPRIDHDPATLSTSTSSVTLASGPVTLAVTVTYPVGSDVRATHDGSNWLSGRVVASTGSSVTLWVDRVVGTGTFTRWALIRVLGLLIEESRTNLLRYSEDFGNAAWVKARVSVSPVGTAPSGAAAYHLREDATNGAHHLQQSFTFEAGASCTYSIFAKEGERKYVRLLIGPGTMFTGSNVILEVDLRNGSVIRNSATSSIMVRPTGDGWWKISVTQTAVVGGIGFAQVVLGRGQWDPGYQGDGTSGIYIWGAQLEVGTSPTSYIPTTTAQVTSAADQCSIANLTDWLGTENTIIIEHNAPAGRVLLSSGATVLATSQGPGKLAIACTATETRICQSGGSVTTSGPLTFDTSLRLLASATAYANAHASVVQSIPRAISNTELQRITA